MLLGGAVTAQAGPEANTSSEERQSQATSPSDTGASTAQGKANSEVGSPESNVDEKSTSGSYYPYAAGTVGDDPEYPKSTAAAHDGKDTATPGATSHWMEADADSDGYLSKDELTKVNPRLAGSFDSIDVDKDGKLTRDELRTWHESNRASMDADQAGADRSSQTGSQGDSPTADDTTPNETAKPDTRAQGQ